MMEQIQFPLRRLKYSAKINPESLSEATSPDFELQYVDIGNVDSYGTVHDIVAYRFEDAPSRARRIVRHGDVIISTVRTYLQAIYPVENPPENLIVSTGFGVIRPSLDQLDPCFCKYALRDNKFLWEVESRSVGVSYPAINSSELLDIQVTLPSLDTQHTIAEYLDRETARIDALVTEKERMLDLLEEKRGALISKVITRGLNPEVSLKPSQFDWLGDIPEHWEERRLKYLTHEPLAYGANEVALEENPDWPRFVRITDINEDGSLRGDTFRSLPPDIAEPFLLENGDVLFARSGATVGKTFIYRREWGKACFAGYLIRFHSAQELILPDFIYYFSLSNIYWQQVESGTIQATIQNFSAEKYASMVICLPPLTEQVLIIDYLNTAEKRYSSLIGEIRNSIDFLKERRAALITAAVTGQISIEEMSL
jgi:type I restriction enzyme S subunit